MEVKVKQALDLKKIIELLEKYCIKIDDISNIIDLYLHI